MGHQLGLGLLLVFAGGMLNGSFAAPLKKLPAWRWENSWLIYSLTGLLIVPWIVAFATVPSLVGVYEHSSFGVLVKVAFFGFAWGIGGLLFGMGMERVGLALGFALILGITSSFGALIPLYLLHPDQLHARPGLALMAGTVVMSLGLVLLAIAGKRRERDQAAATSSKRQNFFLGLVICFFSGIFSAMLNFAFVFGDEMHGLTLYAGASPAMASNAIWALSVTCGCVPNVLYCLLLLFKNRTWGVYKQATSGIAYTSGAALMGVLWFIGIMIYGVGAFVLGPLGGIVGWPVFISTAIIAGNLWGFLGGEWKGASRAALTYCLSGIAILFVAIIVISMGNRS